MPSISSAIVQISELLVCNSAKQIRIVSLASLLTLTAVAILSTPQPGLRLNRGHAAKFEERRSKAVLSERISIQSPGRGNPRINLRDGREVITAYSGAAELTHALEENLARPLSLASADFDEDGVPDLIAGYRAGDGEGIVVLHRGNVDSIYPNSLEAQSRKAEGALTDVPFLSPALVFSSPVGVDFVGAGDFDGDGHSDVVIANHDDNHLYLLTGDGRGGLALNKTIALQGRVTAMVVGEINRRDGLDDIVIGINGETGAKVLVFEGPEGALMAKPETFALPEEATSLALAQLDNDESLDLVIAAAQSVSIIHGRDRKLSLSERQQATTARPLIESRRFSYAIKSLAVGEFDGTQQVNVAMLTEQGDVRLLRRGGPGDRSLKQWKSEVITKEGWTGATGMLSARLSSSLADDLLIVDPDQQKIHFVINRIFDGEAAKKQNRIERQTLSVNVSSAPIAAITMNLNGDAVSDIVSLQTGTAAISVSTSAVSSIITVNSDQDTDTRDNALTLREAIKISNGELSVNDLTASEKAQISGTPTSPGMDEIRFNISSSVASAQPNKIDEVKRAASAPVVGFGAGFGLSGIESFGVSGFTGISNNLLAPAMQAGTDQWKNLGPFGGYVSFLAIDPTNPNTLYAGSDGVFKTTNGGASWNAINSGLSNLVIRTLAIDPTNPNTLYAGSDGGVFKTTNGGASWNAVNSGLPNLVINTLAVDPANPGTVYAGSDGGGVFKTTNGGSSWNAVNSGLSYSFIDVLAIAPTNSNTIYVGTLGGVNKTTNGGANWTVVNSGLSGLNAYSLAIDPTNSNIVYAGMSSGGVFKSTNGGTNWNAVNSGLDSSTIYELAIDPTTPNIIYAGTLGGVYKTTNGTASWNAVNSGLSDLRIEALAIDPTNPNIIYAGTLIDGVNKTTNSGASWNAVNSGFSNLIIRTLAIDPTNPNIIYGGTSGGVFKTTNGGASWNAINSGLAGLSINALAIDLTTLNTLYAGSNIGGIFKTTNGGASWNAVNSGLSSFTISALAIDPTNPNTLYAGIYRDGVFKTTNGGASWNTINSGLSGLNAYSLAIDPTNSNIVYVGTSGGVFKTTNGGASWNAIDSGISNPAVFALAIAPTNPNTIYAGALGINVFKSTNGGSTWAAFGIGLSNQFIYNISIDPSNTSKIYAGTLNGVFTILSTGCTYTLNANTNFFPTAGGSDSVTVNTTAGCNWTANSNANWITVTSGSNGTGTGTVNFSVAPNTESNLRTGSVTIAGQTFTVSQSGTGSDCTVTPISVGQTVNGSLTNTDCLSPFRARRADRYSFAGSVGQQVAIQLTSASFDSYLYLIDSSGNIIAQDDDGAGNSNSRIPSISGFFALPSSGTFRIEVTTATTLSIGANDYTLSLTEGSGTGCSYFVNPASQSFGASEGNDIVAITSPTGCAWTATSNAPFITISAGSNGSGNGTVTFNVTANPSTTTRIGTITIAGQIFTVTQTGTTQCTYSITPQSQNFSTNGGDGNLNVNTLSGCNWTAVSNANFITVLTGSSGSSNGQVSYRVAANTGAMPRSGTITVAGLTFTVIQDGNVQRVTRTINLTSPLPKITDSVIIDGTTQPGIVIEINASGARNADVLSVLAGNSTIKGLVIDHFNASNASVSGILLSTNGNNVIEGCFIGSNAAGTSAAEGPVGSVSLTTGVSIFGSNSNRIGGLTPEARNLISGIDGNGIVISNGATGNRIQGNYIGTDVTGGFSLGHQRIGIYIIESSNNTIGGTEPGAGNLISGNLNWGILVADNASSNTIQGNIIGTNGSGTGKIPNGNAGVFLRVGSGAAATSNTIGGTTPAARNLISGNDAYGVVVGEGVKSTLIHGNYIGTNAAGNGRLGNGYGVIITQAIDTQVGGVTASARNIISGNELTGISIGLLIDSKTGGTSSTIQNNFIGADVNGAALGNKQDGIFVEVNSSTHTIMDNRIAFNGANGVRIPNVTTNPGRPGVQIQMESNLIYNNAQLGIDLGEAGVTANPHNLQTGANLLQNFPELTSVTTLSGNRTIAGVKAAAITLTVTGKLSASPNSDYTIEFFFGSNCEGQGHEHTGAIPVSVGTEGVRTNGSGDATFTYTFDLPSGNTNPTGFVNCTATDPVGNTSEFCQCVSVTVTPSIVNVSRSGKNLIVAGQNFSSRAVIMINDQMQKTLYDDQNPTSILIAKNAGKSTHSGDRVQVRNSDGTVSASYVMP